MMATAERKSALEAENLETRCQTFSIKGIK